MIEETVFSLAALVGGRVIGDGARIVRGVCDLRSAAPDRIGFVRDAKYRAAAAATAAGALITESELDTGAAQIVVADVGVAFAKVALRFHPVPRAQSHEVHPSAVVHPEASIEAPVVLGPNAVVGRARIGAGSVVMANATVGDDCELGRDCAIFPGVVLYAGSRLGSRVVIHAGAVIGSDGFGYAKEGVRYLKVPQLGRVVLGDDVEIGANCTIDRGALGDTRIGARTKIDNLCHIAHNCVFGEDCAVAAACFIAGSMTFGDRVVLGGHVTAAGHLEIGDDVRIGGGSGLLRDIDKPGDYMGYPLLEKKRHARQLVVLRDLIELHADVEELKRRLAPAPERGSS